MEEKNIDEQLSSLMSQLRTVSTEMNFLIQPYTAAVEENLKKIEELSAPYSKTASELRSQIEILALSRAKSYKCLAGNITYVSGGVRRNWKLDNLDLICDSNPHVKQAIWEFRTETPFLPAIRIKVINKPIAIDATNV